MRGQIPCHLGIGCAFHKIHDCANSWDWGVWDPTLGFPGEGPPEFPLKLISINCTAWKSLLYVIRNGEMADYDVIAIQEHKLSQDNIPKAQADILALGWRSFFANCVTTDKNGKSAGVGFLWRKNSHITSPGKTFCDPRKVTLEIDIHDWGPLVLCCFYGWDSKPQEGLRELDKMLSQLTSSAKPYIILGDFNIDVQTTQAHIEGLHVKPLVIEAGSTCFTSVASTLDYAVMDRNLCHINMKVEILDTSLATHKPFSLTLCFKDSSVKVQALLKPPRANSDLVFGPKLCMSIEWQIWHAQYSSLLAHQCADPEKKYFGCKNQDVQFILETERLWDEWKGLAQLEIRANFGIHNDYPMGDKFQIKECTLREHYLNRSATEIKMHYLCQWATRRIQEAIAIINSPKGIAASHQGWHAKTCAKLRQHARDNKFVQGEGIAQDIESSFREPSAENTHLLRFWIQLLQVRSGALLKKERKEKNQEWQHKIQQSIAGGTSLIYRMIREPAPCAQAMVEREDGITTFCSTAVISQQRALWAKWWRE